MGCIYNFNGKKFNSIEALSNHILYDGGIDNISSDKLYFSSLKDGRNMQDADYKDAPKIMGVSEEKMIEYLDSVDEPSLNLKNRSIKLLQDLGISVEYIEGMDNKGVLNLLEGSIKLRNGESLGVLLEEMSHALVEMYSGDKNVDSQQIKQTDEYAKYSQGYREKYSQMGYSGEALEEYVEKEVLGKLIAKEIENYYINNDWSGAKYEGIVGRIRQLIDGLMSFLTEKGRDLDSLVYDIVSSIENETVENFANKDFAYSVYYSLEDKENIDQANNIVQSITTFNKRVEQQLRESGGDAELMAKYVSSAFSIGKQDAEPLAKYLNAQLQDITFYSNLIDKAINSDIDEQIGLNTDIFVREHLSPANREILSTIRALLEDGQYEVSSRDKEGLISVIVNIENKLKEIDPKYSKISKGIILNNVSKSMEDIGASEKTISDTIKSIDTKMVQDIWWMTRKFFSFKNVKNKELAYAYSIVSKANVNARKELSDKSTKLTNFITNKIGSKQYKNLFGKHKGNKTGDIINMFNRAKVDEVRISMIVDMLKDKRTMDGSQLDSDKASNILIDEDTLNKIFQDKVLPSEVLNQEQMEAFRIAEDEVNSKLIENPYLDDYYIERENEYIDIIDRLIDRGDIENMPIDKKSKIVRSIKSELYPHYKSRNAIYDKYIYDGILDISKITEDDYDKIRVINISMKQASSVYDSNGLKKRGDGLLVAQVLKQSKIDYIEDKSNDDVDPGLLNQFIIDFKKNGSSLSWLRKFGTISFSDQYTDILDARSQIKGSYNKDTLSKYLSKINIILDKKENPLLGQDESKYDELSTKYIVESLDEMSNMIKDIMSPYKEGGEVNVSLMPDIAIDKVKEINGFMKTIKRERKLTSEESEKLYQVEFNFIPTSEFRKDYPYIKVNNNINSSRFSNEKNSLYVYEDKNGVFWKWSDIENEYSVYNMTNHEKIKKELFENKHLDDEGSPNFYYNKMVGDEYVIVDGDINDIYKIIPIPGTKYVSRKSGKVYEFEQDKLQESKSINSKNGEILIKQGDRMFLSKIKPNSLYQKTLKLGENVNPNYNPKMSGKTLQYKKEVEYNGRKYSLLDDDYFNLFGISKDDIWGKATKNKELWDARSMMLGAKHEEDNRMGLKNAYFALPQVYKDGADFRLTGPKGISGYLQSLGERHLWTNRQDVDEQGVFDSSSGKGFYRVVGTKVREYVPMNYLYRIEPHKMSDDMLHMYLKYMDASINLKHRSKSMVELGRLSHLVERKVFKQDVNGSPISGKDSNTYKALVELIEREIYLSKTQYVGEVKAWGDNYINVGKAFQAAYKMVSRNALGYNIWVAITGGIMGYQTRFKEYFIEEYGTKKDFNRSAQRIAKSGVSKVSQMGDRVKKDKLLQFLDIFGAEMSDEMLKRMSLGKGLNISSELFSPFGIYRLADMPQLMSAWDVAFNSYRNIDGKWYSYQSFMEDMVDNLDKDEKEAQEIWNMSHEKSLYNHLDIDESGNIKNDEGLENIITAATSLAKHIHTQYTGNLHGEDKPMMSRNPYLAFSGMYKGYFYNAIQQRFKGEHISGLTGATSEGSYRVMARHKKHALGLIFSLGYYIHNKDLKHYEKVQLKRVQADVYMLLTVISLYMAMNGMADEGDEDDYLLQASAYISTRLYGEAVGGEIFGLSETTFDMATNPFQSISQAGKSLLGVGKFGDNYKTGPFKGQNKSAISLLKLTPYANIYKLAYDNPRRANKATMHYQVIQDIIDYIDLDK